MADREADAQRIVNSKPRPGALRWRMKSIFVIAAVLFALGMSPIAPRADTRADCGRFFLKYNAETKQMECAGGKRKRASGTSARSIARDLQGSLQRLRRVVGQAEQLLQGNDLTQEVERRVQALLTEARERTREVQRKSKELAQANRTRSQELASEQRQVTQAQVALARELEQKQRALTQQLMAEQRARTQELLRGSQ